MKKYWKIDDRKDLWVLYLETKDFLHFTQGDRHLTVDKSNLNYPARPATFEEIHGRAFPPKIWGGGLAREAYERDNPHVVCVYYSRWMERWEVAMNKKFELQFPTHAEAIAYAQKHAHQ